MLAMVLTVAKLSIFTRITPEKLSERNKEPEFRTSDILGSRLGSLKIIRAPEGRFVKRSVKRRLN